MTDAARPSLRMYDTELARMINRLHGAPVLAAWEVEGLDEMWVETFFAMARTQREEESLQRHRAALEQANAKWKMNYYRQYG